MPWLRSLMMVALASPMVAAADWPQWLGPDRNGASSEVVKPWKDAPKVLWQVDVGAGHSSPIVSDGVVYLHTKVKDRDSEELSAYDAARGKLKWSKAYPRGKFESQFGDGPRATPVCVGPRLYTFGVTGILTCWSVKSGEPTWQVDTLDKFKAKNLLFGASSSPLVEQGQVIVQVGGEGAAVVAFEGRTGDVAWQSQDDAASYASPVAFDIGKSRQVVVLTGKGLIGLEPKAGKLQWRVPFVDLLNESSTTPIQAGELIVASSVTAGAIAVKPTAKDAEQKWKNAALSCYFSTPVPVGEHLYMVTGSILPPSSTLRCVDTRTGKELWSKGKVGRYHAALLRTGDNKLLMLDDGGHITLIEPNAKAYKELARSRVCGPTWAHPALSDGRLFLRDEKKLLCIELPK